MRNLLVAILILNWVLQAQPSYKLIDLHSDTNWNSSEAGQINNNGTIVGIAAVPGFASSQAIMWQGNSATVLPIGNGGIVRPNALNDSGWVVGMARNASNEQFAFLYRDGMVTDLGSLGGGAAVAYAVNSQGQITGTSFDTTFTIEVFFWENGAISKVGRPTGANQTSGLAAYAITEDGSVVVNAPMPDGTRPHFWNQGTWTPLGFRGSVFDINSVNQAVGRQTLAGVTGILWDNGNLQTIFDSTSAAEINNAGQVIGDQDWYYEDGVAYRLSTLIDSTGNGWTSLRPRSINNRGEIVGVGWYNNHNRAFLLKRKAISIASPTSISHWRAEQKDTVRWEAEGVAFFSIDLSVDDGQNWTNIDFSVTAGDSQFVYEVPDRLFSTNKARVRVSNLFDSTQYAISAPFTIKGYDLTRTLPNGDWQNFEADNNGWVFRNDTTNMWPRAWYQQFIYLTATDPYTNEKYPGAWFNAPINARSWNFPDWPLFVEVFGVEQSYWSTTLNIYKDAAVDTWRGKKRRWGGSCYGHAISSLLAFQFPDEFRSRFPTIAQTDSLYYLFMTNSIRKLINQHYVHQYGQVALENDVTGQNKTPRDLLFEVRQMFLDENHLPRALSFYNNGPGGGAHTVVPTRLRRDGSNSGQFRLYLYNSNYPGNVNNFIFIDSTANTWTDSTGFGWGSGNNRCYLEPAIDQFLQAPVLGTTANNKIASSGYLQLSVTEFADAVISNTAGESIGWVDSLETGGISGGMAIIPKVGALAAPIGYYLPNDNYTIELGDFADSLIYISANYDSVTYNYDRAGVQSAENEKISVGDGITVSNPDAAARTIRLETIYSSTARERVAEAADLTVTAGDSLRLQMPDDEQLILSNYGAAGTYQLTLKQNSATQASVFHNPNVSLPANSSHMIVPVWTALDSTPVKIYIDNGNDGSIDDSTLVQNVPLGIDDSGDIGIPALPDRFVLHQNYPNPFNPATTIEFELPAASVVTLEIYDIIGRHVVGAYRDTHLRAGAHKYNWNATDAGGIPVPSGVYFYRLVVDRQIVATRKMLLIR